jgi:hypothetical protein
MEAITSTTANINDLVEIRAMKDWMGEASGLPVPKQLFDDLWREGELAILFGDTGKGKSALAVQIGESIARGRPMHPFGLTAKPRDVLLLDLEMTEKQIEMRYSADHDPAKGDILNKKYSFSKRFHRVVVRPEILYRHDGEPLESVLRDLLQPLITETRASALIIDNITHLKRTAESYRETVPIMKELQRLKRRFGLSILVIAHRRKRDAKRRLSINDLEGAGSLASGADNVFAIGQSRRNSSERYIKHLKPRNAEAMYDGSHVPVFDLKKISGNFLGFAFTEFAPEAALLAEPKDGADWPMIERIKQMQDGNKSIRLIADELDISKTAVHRYLQMWRPPAKPEKVVSNAPLPDPTRNSYYFLGREEYEAAKDELRAWGEDDEEYFTDDAGIAADFRRRESYVIECAAADARKNYLETGIAPKLGENEEYRAFKDAVRVYHESGGSIVQEPIEFIVRRWFPSIEQAAAATANEVPHAPPSQIEDADDPFADMHVGFDANNDRIFIEAEWENGKPRVWYKYDVNGLLHCYERDPNGISRSRANADRFGKFVRRE